MKISRKSFLIFTSILITIVSGGVVFHWQSNQLVPSTVKDKTTFAIMIPSGKDIEINKKSMAVSTPQGQDAAVLNYTAKIDGIDILVGQQPTPQQFVDIPMVYEKVVDQSKRYASFETTVGTVYLTRPQKQQLAMLNSKGTYMLAQATKDLTQDQWRRFFRNVTLIN